MLTDNMLVGSKVRLTALMADDIRIMARWYSDAGFLRLYDARPAFPMDETALKEQIDSARKKADGFYFAIRPLGDDQLLGYLEIDGILWAHQVAWMGIGIGERSNWGKGYGADAMRLGLNFAFQELNLQRVQLTVFSYNERALALYERLGFRREGTFREFLQRDGRRYDMYLYGLLRREWTRGVE